MTHSFSLSDRFSVSFITVLAVVLWCAGFGLSLPFVRPYELSMLAALSCGLSAGALVIGRHMARGCAVPFARPGAIVAGLVLFTGLAAASLIWSAVPYVSLIAFCTFLILPVSVFMFLCASDRAALVRWALGGALAIVAAYAAWVLYAYAFLPDYQVFGQLRYPFANPNSGAALLGLAFFPLLGGAFVAQAPMRRVVRAVTAALVFAALIVLGGRAPFLTVAAALVLFFVLARRHVWGAGGLVRGHGRGHVAVWVILMVAGVAAFTFPLLLGEGQTSPVRRALDLAAAPGSVWDTRYNLWRDTWSLIAAQPWIGTGFGTFALHFGEFRFFDVGSGGYMAHNDPLQFWAELGIGAVLIYYAVMALVVVRMAAYLRAVAPDDPQRVMTVALFCGLAVIGVHQHVDYDFYVPAILYLFGLCLAWWLLRTEAAHAQQKSARGFVLPAPWRAAGYVLALAPVAGLLFLLQGVLIAQHSSARAQAAFLRDDMTAFAALVNRANNAGFGWHARPYVLAAAVPLGVLEARRAELSLPETAAFVKEADALLDKAEARNPRLVTVPYYRARLSQLAGEADDVTEGFLQDALRLSPLHLPARVMLADVYIARKDLPTALGVLKEGLVWPYLQHNPAAYYRKVWTLGHVLRDQSALDALAEAQNRQAAYTADAVRKMTPDNFAVSDGP